MTASALLAAGHSARLAPHVLVALIPVLAVIVLVDGFCLVNLVRARSVRNLPKPVWAIVILLVSAPFGALLYLFLGMDRGGRRERRGGRSKEAVPAAPWPGDGWTGGGSHPAAPEAGHGHPAASRPGAVRSGGIGPGAGQIDVAEAARPGPAHVGQVGAANARLPGPAKAAQPGPVHVGPHLTGWSDAAAQRGPVGTGPAGDGLLVLTTTGLTRDYGGTGLFDVDLRVPRGSVYGLVGLNGAGKTTLLSLVAGTRRADRGSVHMTVERSKIAVCPDVPEFDGWLTASEVVDLARSLVAPAPVADPEAVWQALATAGLADSAGRRVAGFSRGMIQRLGLACALVGDPDLLILDEPTSALDPAGRAEMLSLVAAMRGRRTVIFSSHILSDVQRIADQVGILRDGRLLYQGPTRDLIDTYLTPSWLVRLADGVGQVAAAAAAEPWVTNVETTATDAIRIDAISIEAGERGIPRVIAGCAARMVSCEPAAADLESAFLSLTGAGVAR